MARHTKDFVYFSVVVNRSINMRARIELLENQPRLSQRRRRRPIRMARQLRKNAPHGARLQCHDNLSSRSSPHKIDDRQIALQRPPVEHKTRRRYFREINHQSYFTNAHRSVSRALLRQPRPLCLRSNTPCPRITPDFVGSRLPVLILRAKPAHNTVQHNLPSTTHTPHTYW